MKTYKRIVEEPCLVIKYDDSPQSPREWDNLGKFITVDHQLESPDRDTELDLIVSNTGREANSLDEHIALIKKETNALAVFPIVKYEHSAISYSLGPKHGFDYSNNGFYIVPTSTTEDPKDFERIIKAELELYNAYINGRVYQYSLHDENGELIDSCGDFYDIKDIREHLPEEYKNEDLTKYLK